jgi:hypothetical protein
MRALLWIFIHLLNEFLSMKNPSVILVILSLLFLIIPIIQQMIPVKQENKLALIADVISESEESSSVYENAQTENLEVNFIRKIECYFMKNENSADLDKTVVNSYKQKLESPPPQY